MVDSSLEVEFDYYHKWLGVSKRDQPPDHYRLLGIPTFTDDPEVIQHSYDQRMAFLRTLQLKHPAKVRDIMEEIIQARQWLLSPEKKLQYDRNLRVEYGVK